MKLCKTKKQTSAPHTDASIANTTSHDPNACNRQDEATSQRKILVPIKMRLYSAAPVESYVEHNKSLLIHKVLLKNLGGENPMF